MVLDDSCNCRDDGYLCAYHKDLRSLQLNKTFIVNPEGGKKETGGKRSNHGVPMESIWNLSDHMMKNALSKYGHRNYQRGMRLSQFIDAAESHLAALRRGEMVDPATGESHIDALGANWLMMDVCRRLGTLNVDVAEVYADAPGDVIELRPGHPALSRTPWADGLPKKEEK